jgi:hypothetical protein
LPEVAMCVIEQTDLGCRYKFTVQARNGGGD